VTADLQIPKLLDGLTLIASQAAAAILAVPRQDLDRRDKEDASPVTAADAAAERLIRDSLAVLVPDVPLISEETTEGRPSEGPGPRFLLADPLDGTRDFLAGLDEYTVNIALIENGQPTLGVVAAPARGLIWRGHVGHGAERLKLAPGAGMKDARERIPIRVRLRPAVGARVAISRSHLDPATTAYVERLPKAERIVCGSSLKFCLVAEGTADIYPRLGPISEWDIAAGHAVLAAAGGEVRTPDGLALRYGARDFRVAGFIASGEAKS
jgi:3'(2'), 5'-bisphosphate nucleotidase